MKQILIDIARAIVDNPDAVTVTEKIDGNSVYLQLSVDQSDMGKVIGKQGRIAKAIRTVVKASANHDNKKVIVDIV
jgi:Predicted RNA-binding protein (contains KH domain)